MVFAFGSVYVIDYVWRFTSVEPALHPRDEVYLIVMNKLFDVLLHSIYQDFTEDFCIDVHHEYWPEVIYFILHMEPKKSPHSQVHSKQIEQSGRHHTTGLQIILRGYSNQNSMGLVPKQRYQPTKRDRGLGGNTTYLQPSDL